MEVEVPCSQTSQAEVEQHLIPLGENEKKEEVAQLEDWTISVKENRPASLRVEVAEVELVLKMQHLNMEGAEGEWRQTPSWVVEGEGGHELKQPKVSEEEGEPKK